MRSPGSESRPTRERARPRRGLRLLLFVDVLSSVSGFTGAASLRLTSVGYHLDGDVFKVENAETFANDGTSLLIVVATGAPPAPAPAPPRPA